MDRILNFLIGAGNVLCLFPQASRIDYSSLIVEMPFHDSVQSALEADWQKVGSDMYAAIALYDHQGQAEKAS
jgi:hypothetical protein